ncbi:hypothetical protein ABTM23_19010, partial [Acinetobacter baumannii]
PGRSGAAGGGVLAADPDVTPPPSHEKSRALLRSTDVAAREARYIGVHDATGDATMFCKPPCPDMNDHLDDKSDDVLPAPGTSDVPAGRDDHDSRG